MTILLVIIALSLLVLIHELGHFAAAKLFGIRVEEFGFGFPPRLWSFTRGVTRYSLNLFPFGGFVRIFGEDAPPSASDPDASRAFVSKPLAVRALVIGGGVVMNFLAGWLLLSSVFMAGSASHLGISLVAPDSPAEVAGLAAGDLVLAARAGETALTDPISLEGFIKLVETATAEGAALSLTVRRAAGEETVMVSGRAAPPEGEGALGVVLFDTGFSRTGVFESFVRGAEATFALFRAIAVGLAEFFIGLFTEAETFQMVTGPVGVVAVVVSSVSFGFAPFLNLMALISLHLALLNFLPLPALDGGRLFFLVLEGLKGSPVSRKVERMTHAVGFALLLLLMVVVTVKDIGRLVH
ncbi:MAG: site-2 protease family protein [Candidatus Jorgensenbacteria bacterium]|nr:site-2 protease family protein [Candidatus Jorgensenbacteria bacterium]